MREPPGRRAVVVLFAVAACALVAATTLTAAVAARHGGAERNRAGARVAGPSPAGGERATRPAGPPTCLIGSWRTVEETLVIRFYADQEPILFTGSGRQYEFRPDGTGVERQDDVVLTGSFRGTGLRIVGNGAIDFTWTADQRSITYVTRTNATLTWSYYDQHGLIGTHPVRLGRLDEVDDYTCEGGHASEGNATGYRAAWVRTAAFGVYGA